MKAFPCLVFLALTLSYVSADHDDDYDKTQCLAGPHTVSNLAPDADPIAPDTFRVTWLTTASDKPIVIEAVREWSPLGVDRFYQLVQDNFFDCAAFFRVVPGFVVQLGLASDPAFTDKWTTEIPDDPVVQSNLKSYLSFATSGPDSRTTQIFVNVANNPSLDESGFSPFARVISGMNVFEELFNPTPGDSGGLSQSSITQQGNAWIWQNAPDTDIIRASEFSGGAMSNGGGVGSSVMTIMTAAAPTAVVASLAAWL